MTTDLVNIALRKAGRSRIEEVDFNNLPFGKHFSDHMFVADYADGQWQNLQVVPFDDFTLSPALSSLHYGQSIFEGMKAYKNEEGEVLLFRPLENWKRMNESAKRMCMATIPEEVFMGGLEALLRVDAAWVPTTTDSSLYIRPYMFGTDTFLGVAPSKTYRFCIFTCPVGAYYTKPPKLKVETEYIRSAPGGVGYAKCAGNYAGSMYPTLLAQQAGYDQLMWTDATEHKYIEESGTMNIMFVIDGKLVTPATSDSILKGVTRDSILKVVKSWGIEVEERKVSIQEVIEGIENGSLTEAFGAGTAVVVSPYSLIGYEGKDYMLSEVPKENSLAHRIFTYLNDLRTGRSEDTFGWMHKVV
ncbi:MULTISPECIES: branched-chain amino acid aminotransferase [Larkinella]|uniref:branched-chain-amino-acid transaminase n=1 Tax=Larkinella humicola TaxID=2607654 RepID=A0A5N1J3P9_9BACT|nr:branched-chain amino acid aminotransferase [Larkinella humicola]KAA9340386.1 branched-chain amino acid aminotransferase [Larkinella humicola]